MRVAKTKQEWRLSTPIPAREVFATMEQMMGTPPFRFEVTGENSARVLEFERKGMFGGWVQFDRDGQWYAVWKRFAKRRVVTLEATEGELHTQITVAASKDASAKSRALQIVQLLDRGKADSRTIYRDRNLPLGSPATLVASWAGMPYRLFAKPERNGKRTGEIKTATPLTIVGYSGTFVEVRTGDGEKGYVERDEIVAAPAVATRAAQAANAWLTGDTGGQQVSQR